MWVILYQEYTISGVKQFIYIYIYTIKVKLPSQLNNVWNLKKKCMKFLYVHTMRLEQIFIHEKCMKISYMEFSYTFHTNFMYEIPNALYVHTKISYQFHTYFSIIKWKVKRKKFHSLFLYRFIPTNCKWLFLNKIW